MRPGIEIAREIPGTGPEATGSLFASVRVRAFLNRGEEAWSGGFDSPLWIGLKDRGCIAGLRYAIEGMRVGGQRTVVIGPHLAYGSAGIPGMIPQDAVIRCEIELCDVREQRPPVPAEGKRLGVMRPGETARNLPRWQFGLENTGRCGVRVSFPPPGMHWRHAVEHTIETQLDPAEAQALFDTALTLPDDFPEDCPKHDACWADMGEKGNNITRDQKTNTLCWSVYVTESGRIVSNTHLKETSRAIRESPLFRLVAQLASGESPKP